MTIEFLASPTKFRFAAESISLNIAEGAGVASADACRSLNPADSTQLRHGRELPRRGLESGSDSRSGSRSGGLSGV